MSMTRKQFIALAGELQLANNYETRTVADFDEAKQYGFDLAVNAVIAFCKKENARFDEQRFRNAVYNND